MFWHSFSDRYGVDVEIKIVKYDKVEDMLDQKFRVRGSGWTSFDVDDSMFFDLYSEIHKMPFPERR